MIACTVTIHRRLAYARVLANSFLVHHPAACFYTLVVDGPVDHAAGPHGDSTLMAPADIGISPTELSMLAMIYRPTELIAALVPRLLGFLTREGEPTLYFGDDSMVFGSLDDLAVPLKETPVLLARRSQDAIPIDNRTPARQDFFRAGVYETAFVGVAEGASGFISAWAASVLPAGLPWENPASALDTAACHWPHAACEDPGLGVSLWNLQERRIAKRKTGLFVAGMPLRVFHFHGYDPGRPHLLSPGQGPAPRILLSERPDLTAVTAEYGAALMSVGHEQSAQASYKFENLAGGPVVDDRMRAIYREALQAHLADDAAAPPDPFDQAAPSAFVEWLNRPDENAAAPEIGRYLNSIYKARTDLQIAFPGITGAGAAKYLEWVMQYGADELDLPDELLPKGLGDKASAVVSTAPRGYPARSPLPFGLNVIGYFKAELGVGEVARLIVSALDQTAVPYATRSYFARHSRQNHPFEETGDGLEYNTNLLCVNADQLGDLAADMGAEALQDRYNIGVWWWEVETLPKHMAKAASMLDEIWVGSKHVGRAIVAGTDKPVKLIPLPIRAGIGRSSLSREQLGLPAGFVFLFTFDFLSIFERKNPIGVVEAFKRAFSNGHGPHLVIKSINGRSHLTQLEELKMAAAGRDDIVIIDGYFPPDQRDALIASCDCCVSLHRSEGFGLGMAEAMANGKPIIATGYSGNLAFLNNDNSYLVGHKLVPIPPSAGPYAGGGFWAEPNLDEAAEEMRRVYGDPDEARRKGERARADAVNLHTFKRTAQFIRSRLETIRTEQANRRMRS